MPALPGCRPALLLTALLALNLALFFSSPGYLLGLLLRGPSGGAGWPTWLISAQSVLAVAVAVLGVPLLLVPALVVCEGRTFRGAVGALGRAVLRRPVPLVLSYLVLLVLQVLPLGTLLVGVWLEVAGVGPWTPGLVGTVLGGIGRGVTLGLLVYATARIARWPVGPDDPESQVEPSSTAA